jgi:hypothetical protein
MFKSWLVLYVTQVFGTGVFSSVLARSVPGTCSNASSGFVLKYECSDNTSGTFPVLGSSVDVARTSTLGRHKE